MKKFKEVVDEDVYDVSGYMKMVEAVYPGNLGLIEIVNYYRKANDKQKKAMDIATKNKDWDEFKRLIKDVLGVKLI